MNPDPHHALEHTTARVKRAEAELAAAQADRMHAIRNAIAHGIVLHDVMAITGLSRRSVYYAVEKSRRST